MARATGVVCGYGTHAVYRSARDISVSKCLLLTTGFERRYIRRIFRPVALVEDREIGSVFRGRVLELVMWRGRILELVIWRGRVLELVVCILVRVLVLVEDLVKIAR